MRTFDLTPLLRSSIGFDRFDRLFDNVQGSDQGQPGYPPYNIVKTDEDSYRITMAVAGFADEDLDVTVTDNTLVITGKQKAEESPDKVRYLHRGIAARAFERRFELVGHIKVVGAKLENGLLHVDLAREVPEHLKPRQIAISRAAA